MHTIQTLWGEIDEWFKTNAPSFWDPSSSPGASEEEIAHVEQTIGRAFPDDFKASYRIHNGGCPFPGRPGGPAGPEEDMPYSPWPEGLMSLKKIVGIWEMFVEHREQGYIVDFPDLPEGPVRPSHWLSKWIPFAWGGYGGDFACLDLDPGPGGHRGQIVLRTHESDPATLLAPSFGSWLATLADDLKTNSFASRY